MPHHRSGQIAESVNRAGNGLLNLGIQEEQRVMLILPDVPEFVVAYFAAMKIGAVAVREGMRRLRDDGLAKVKAGLTSMAEVARVTGEG